MKKKLLVVTSEYFHPLTTRLHHMLVFLAEHFDITIVAITSSRFDLANEKSRGLIASMNVLVKTVLASVYRKPLRNGDVLVLRYPIPDNNLTAPFGHIFDSILVAWLMKIRKIGKGFDVCLVSPGIAGFPTLLAKMPMPVVYEDVDRFEFFTDDRLKRRIVRFMENYCIRNSAEVISAGYSLASSAEHIRGKKVRCIPNGVNLKLFSENRGKQDVKDRFGIVYVGYISEWSGLEMAIESLPIIISSFPSAKLFIVGTGEQHSIKKLADLALKLRISSSVVFMGPKKHEELPQIMKEFVVGLAIFPNMDLMRFAFPLKIMEYMAAGLPIIATNVGDTGTILRKSKCGLLVDYNAASIAEGITQILGDQDYAASLARNGQKWVKEFDFSLLAKEEADLLLALNYKSN